MPSRVDEIHDAIMRDPDFKPRPGKTKDESAWAIAWSKKSKEKNDEVLAGFPHDEIEITDSITGKPLQRELQVSSAVEKTARGFSIRYPKPEDEVSDPLIDKAIKINMYGGRAISNHPGREEGKEKDPPSHAPTVKLKPYVMGMEKSGPPGPPPREGLVWNESTSRWRHHESGQEYWHGQYEGRYPNVEPKRAKFANFTDAELSASLKENQAEGKARRDAARFHVGKHPIAPDSYERAQIKAIKEERENRRLHKVKKSSAINNLKVWVRDNKTEK